jgi:hypothetical protein
MTEQQHRAADAGDSQPAAPDDEAARQAQAEDPTSPERGFEEAGATGADPAAGEPPSAE